MSSGDQLALIVEDNDDLANLFAEAMQAAQFKTEIIQDGLAARKRLGEVVPSILVLDMHLPHVSGMDILREVRVGSRMRDVQVIVVTADASAGSSVNEQADLVLLKPVTYSQLSALATRLRTVNVKGSPR
jgi:two-component system cell cycle response regulator DivK